MKTIILTGPAGAGKTSLAEYIASQNLAKYITLQNEAFFDYILCHEWVTAEDFTYSINIPTVAKTFANLNGNSPFYIKGIIARAIEKSKTDRVVALVDELDKASTRIDALLLDFAQNCRVLDPEGNLIYGNSDNITLFITSNRQRDLIDPLMRRGFKVELKPLPSHVEAELLLDRRGTYYLDKQRKFIIDYVNYVPISYANDKLQRLIAKIAEYLRSQELDISLYEMKHFYLHIPVCGSSVERAKWLIEGWLCRNDDYKDALNKRFKGIHNLANAVLDLYWQGRRTF